MLAVHREVVILWLHVLGACVWIGGQIVVAAAIPLARRHAGLAAAMGRRYQTIAWPAFAVLVVTGILNVGNAGIRWAQLLDTPVGRTLTVKLALVALSGGAAAVHAVLQAPRTRDPRARPVASALLGSASLLAAVLAALYGVVIASGGG